MGMVIERPNRMPRIIVCMILSIEYFCATFILLSIFTNEVDLGDVKLDTLFPTMYKRSGY